LPLQPQQPQYGQQPQQPQQPQYYAPPPPNFSGILHTLAQHVSTLTQNSIATQQAMTTLLAEHMTLSNSIQHLNLSNQQTQQLLQCAPAVAGGNASFTTKVHTMEKLEKFDGTRNNSARTFLVRFALWAQSLGAQMNRFDAAGNCVGPHHDLWVQSALGYMTGEAAVWAKPYMTQMLLGQTLFLNAATNQISWDKFQTAFHMRWISIANDVTAWQKLVTLRQGTLLVEAFYSRFKALADRSGLSKVDLLERFKASINEDILMTMAEVHSVSQTRSADPLRSPCVSPSTSGPISDSSPDRSPDPPRLTSSTCPLTHTPARSVPARLLGAPSEFPQRARITHHQHHPGHRSAVLTATDLLPVDCYRH
jgi:hypothetical protein